MDEDTQPLRRDPAEFFERVPFATPETIEAPDALRAAPRDARDMFTPVDIPDATMEHDTVQPVGERAPLPHELQTDLVRAQRALEMISCHPDLDLGLTPAPLGAALASDADIDYGSQRVGRLNFGRNGIEEVEYARGQFEVGLIALGELLDTDVSHALGYDEYPEFVNRELQAENAAFAIMKMRYLVERNGERGHGARPSARVARHERAAIYDAVEQVQTNPDGWREELAVVVEGMQALDRHLEAMHMSQDHDLGH